MMVTMMPTQAARQGEKWVNPRAQGGRNAAQTEPDLKDELGLCPSPMLHWDILLPVWEMVREDERSS